MQEALEINDGYLSGVFYLQLINMYRKKDTAVSNVYFTPSASCLKSKQTEAGKNIPNHQSAEYSGTEVNQRSDRK